MDSIAADRRRRDSLRGNLRNDMAKERYEAQTTIRTTSETARRIDALADGALSALDRSAVLRAALRLGLGILEGDYTKAFVALRPSTSPTPKKPKA